jgi:hypothetical protein
VTYEPIITFTEDDHILGVWFAAFEGFNGGPASDVMATLWRRKGEEGQYHFTLRVRMDDATDGNPYHDTKHSEHVTFAHPDGKSAERRATEFMETFVGAHPGAIAMPLQHVRIGGDDRKMIRRLRGLPWVRISRMPDPS